MNDHLVDLAPFDLERATQEHLFENLKRDGWKLASSLGLLLSSGLSSEAQV